MRAPNRLSIASTGYSAGVPTSVPRSYVYEAIVLDIVDGDTAKFAVRLRKRKGKNTDLGFHVMYEGDWLVVHETMRFFGINAPEHATPAGDAATAYLKTILPVGATVSVTTVPSGGQDKTEKFGRFLATVIYDSKNINDDMVASGHASLWDGHGPRPVPGG
jgi:endonuclease YncB( thermonuclease family)